MLRNLQVRDLAIIDAVQVDLAAGLTVLTGETGAGKSMLVDALELLSGARAGAEVVRAGAERAELSASFDISRIGAALRHVLEEHSIPAEEELLLRRVIGSDGRSRAWVNGQSVPVAVLKQVGELLLDIHGQHEFQSLMRPAAQRGLLDDFGQLESLLAAVRSAHASWLTLMDRSLAVEAAASDRHARLDLLRYQVQELDSLRLQPGEPDELAAEHQRMHNSGRLAQAARTALELLYEAEDGNAHQLAARAAQALRGAVDPRLAQLQGPLEEQLGRLQELAHELSHYLEGLEFDPQRQEAVERRLAAIEELARKHRVGPADLAAWHAALQRELATMEGAAADIGALRTQVAAALATYQAAARELSIARRRAGRDLAMQVTRRMQELGMTGGSFGVDVSPLDSAEPAPHGTDRVEFRVSTNPGQPPRAVAKIASGGELARLSLAVQVCCARHAAPCMVFDEVDAGVGGAVAEIVGRELRGLGAGAQVLCVTHLPQVACQGHQQLKITKLTDGRNTRISVAALADDARVEEIARMLGGVDITARTRSHAREMLQQAAGQRPVGGPALRRGQASR